MQIGVIGATGTIGSRIVTEALGRGHHVTAFSRDVSGVQYSRENIRWKNIDVTDAEGIAAALPGLDVLISGFGAGNAASDPADAVARAIADPGIYARAAASLLTALEAIPGSGSSSSAAPRVWRSSPDWCSPTPTNFSMPRSTASACQGNTRRPCAATATR